MAIAKAIEFLTYSDYLKLDDDVRCELIDGVLYNMAAPTVTHQQIAGRLFRWLGNFLEGKSCRAFIAPVDVRLNANKSDDTVVQPDVMVLCDKNKIDPTDRGIIGAPDLVIEVMSPSSRYTDRILKHKKYLEAGVLEYWIVDPEHKTVDVYLLDNGRYYSWNYGGDDVIPVQLLKGLEINLTDLFE
ncbi:MAG: Uma2 family endonuclease [Defluviitaleaceae bacterium]|nr:Uma2 family endonuclease [Defluviitaleaceae bacterium]